MSGSRPPADSVSADEALVAAARPSWWQRGPGGVLHALLGVIVVLFVATMSDPKATSALPFAPVAVFPAMLGLVAWLLAELLVVLVAPVWLARSAIAAVARWRRGATPNVLPMVAMPALAVAVVALASVTKAPLRVRWAVSRPAFDRVAETARSGRAAGSTRGLVGAYPVERVQVVGDGVVVLMGGDGHPWVAFLHTDRPDPDAIDRYPDNGVPLMALGGGWYAIVP